MKARIEHQSIFAEMAISYKTKKEQMRAKKLNTSIDVYQYLNSLWNHDLIEYQEEFVIVMLNRANNIIGWIKISCGGMAGTVTDPKIIFSSAILAGASSIILSHNHPSGNLKPSTEDVELTKKIIQAGKLLDIMVLDHIIMTSDAYLSFADEGLMQY